MTSESMDSLSQKEAEERLHAMARPPVVRNCSTCIYMESIRLPNQIQQQMVCRRFPPAMIGIQSGPTQVQGMPLPTFVSDGVWCWEYLHPDDAHA